MTFSKRGLSLFLSLVMCLSLAISPGATLVAYADTDGGSNEIAGVQEENSDAAGNNEEDGEAVEAVGAPIVTRALVPEATFDIVVEILEFGAAVTAVIIDTKSEISSISSDVLNSFTVSAVTRNPRNNAEIFNGERTIIRKYVSTENAVGKSASKGRYIVLELRRGFNNTDALIDGCSARFDGTWLDMEYTVMQDTNEISFNEAVKPIYEEFELVDNPVEGYTGQKYRMYTPKEADDGQKLPLVIFNHGIGEMYSAANINESAQIVQNMGGVGWVKNAPEASYVLAPQRGFSGYSRAGVIAFVQDLIDQGKVDANRVYVSGASAGGQETINYLLDFPDFFAAGMPICTLSGGRFTAAQMETIKHIPIWSVQAENDALYPNIVNGVAPYNLLKAAGAKDARLTLYPKVFGQEFQQADYEGHFSWIMVLNNEYVEDGGVEGSDEGTTFMDWLFKQRKPAVYAEGATVKADANSPTGYTVTFIYKNANATSVKLAGDLTQRDLNDPLNPVVRYQPEDWKTGRYHTGGTEFLRAMEKVDNEYWMVSIPMHAGGLSYWYRVDDPTQGWANKRIWDPAAEHPRPAGNTTYRTNNNDVLGAVYVPYDAKQNDPTLESRAKYELPAAVRGTVTYVPYTPWTPAEYPDLRQPGEDYYLGVYLPPDYDENRAEPYPVVYLNHGVYGDETDWMVPGNAPNIIDNMIANGEIEPTVLVTVGNHFSTVPGPGTGMPENGYNPPTAAKNIVNAVMPFMETNYNVSTEASGRAVGGFSYGGTTTWNVMYDYADLFGYFGLFSAAGNLSTAQLDNIQAKAAGEPRFVMIGNGKFESALSNSGRDSLRSIGFKSETHQVPGAHDMMTAGQLFTIFARDYLWKEESAAGAQSVRPITEVRWWGQQVGGVVLEFAENVDTSTLTAADFGIQDTAYNTSFDPSSVATSRAMLVNQPIKDVFTVADPSLLLENERPEAPGRYLVVTVDLDNTWFGRSISLLGGMYVRINPNPPTEITIKKNIYSTDGTLLAKTDDTPLTMTDVPVVNRGVDEYTQDVFNATVGTALNYSYRLPDNYDPAKEYPLVVYLTGMGQGYTVSGGVNNLGANIATEASSQFWFSDEFKEEFGEDVIFLAPQSSRSLTVAVQAEQVAELIEGFSAQFAVDTQRVHFYTLSYGGRLGWWLAANRPDLFAAVMPTSFDTLNATQAAQIAEAELPVQMVAGINDHLMTYPMTTTQRDLLLKAYRDRGVSEERIAELVKWREFDHEDFDRVGVPCPVEWVGTDNHYMAGYPGAYNPENPRSRRDQHISLIPALRDNPEITEWLLAQVKPLKRAESPTVIEDPASPTGYFVEFVYYNPRATAVRLAGDLTLAQNYVTGTAGRRQPEDWEQGWYHAGGTEFLRDMVNDGNGYWSVKLPLHAGGLSYWYRVDGDPELSTLTNARIWDPTATHPRPETDVGNGYVPWRSSRNDVLGAVYVPYDPVKQNDTDLESRAIYELPRSDASERGTVRYIPYTTSTGVTSSLGVYLPPGYDENREKPYPVMYAHHGNNGDETDYMIPGNIPNIIDNMVARGELEPTIVVTMSSMPITGGTAPNNNRAQNLINVILPLIEEKYNASNEPGGRAVGGFSMGSSDTYNVLRAYPNVFGYYALFCGSTVTAAVAGEIAAAAEMAGVNTPFVFMGRGTNEGALTNWITGKRACVAEGIPAAAHYAVGAHDMTTVGRLFTTFAKNYLWKENMVEGPTVKADENSPTGYTVEFVYYNPNATTVRLAGDLTLAQNYVTGTAGRRQPEDWEQGWYHAGGTEFLRDMVNDGNGYWSVKLPLHAGGLSYWYRVDGDPSVYTGTADTVPAAGARIWDPVSTHPRPEVLYPDYKANRTRANDVLDAVYVPYDPVKQNDPDLANRAIYELPRNNAAEKGTVTYIPYTTYTGGTSYLGVYLPPGYSASREKPYPVMYACHGGGGDETDYMIAGNTPNIIDNLIARGEMEPTILVTMAYTVVSGTTDGISNQARNIVETILPFIENRYNASSEPGGRAIGGFSAGSAMSLTVLRAFPTAFSYFGLFCGGSVSAADATTVSAAAKAAGVDSPFVFMGRGTNEGPLTSLITSKQICVAAGIPAAAHHAVGAHDMTTVGRLFTTFAKNYLWKENMVEGPTVKADENSPTGYSVTFVYKNDNATRVQLAGDLGLVDLDDVTPASAPNNLPRYQPEDWKTGRYSVGGVEWRRDMVNDGNGYWSVTVPLHAGGLSYWYRVSDPVNSPDLMINASGTSGGLRIWDPASKHPRPPVGFSWRETRNDVLDVVYIPYDQKLNDPTLETRATYQLPRDNPAESGSVKYVPYTANNGSTAYLGIYLPAGYDPDRAEPYKVMYLGHGGGGDETDWMIPGNAPYVMDNAVARGEIEPTILVSIGYSFLPGGMAGATDNLINRILPYMETNYNVSKEGEGRAYGGFSNGASYGDMLLEDYTDMFGYFGYFSTIGAKNLNFSKIASAEKVPFVHVGNGIFESAQYKSNMSGFYANLQKAGIPSAYYQFEGAHDMMTASSQFTTFVKNHLWKPVMKEGPTVKADPESPTGYSVTFVYKNENATSVKLAGDLTLRDVNDTGTRWYQPEDWKTGRYHVGGTEFTRAMTDVGNGYWTVTIPMHAGGLSYWYRVDDPSQGWTNKRIWDPTAAHPRPPAGNSYRETRNDVLGAVYVPYDEKQNDPTLESRATYELPRENPAERGNVSYIPYTNINGATDYLGVYLPAGYDPNRAEPYKVMYLSHGIYGDETDWMVPGNAPNIIDNMIERGEIEPTILVTTGNHLTPGRSYNTTTAANNIANVVIPLMEANYNVSKERDGRAYGGFSMGGMTGGPMMNLHADKFAYYGFFSGSPSGPNYNTIAALTGGKDTFVMLGNGSFEGALTSFNTVRDNLRKVGIGSETHQVPGAHDMMTAGQLFTVFAKDYLWKPITAPPVSVTGVTLDKNTITLSVGDSETLIATVAPENAANKTVTWISSDDEIATVDENGKVTGIAPGSATVLVRTEDGNFVASCTVNTTLEVQSIRIDSAATTTVRKTKTLQLSVILTPANANLGSGITWSSSNTAAVTVNANGLITGVKAGGSARITATSSNGKTYTITVTVDS